MRSWAGRITPTLKTAFVLFCTGQKTKQPIRKVLTLTVTLEKHSMITYWKKNARIASHLSRWQKNYTRLLFEGCRNFIIEKHPNAFGTIEAGEPGRTTFENFNQLVTSLSNKDLTKAREIRSAPLYDVMAQLEAFAIEGKKMRELSNQKPKY